MLGMSSSGAGAPAARTRNNGIQQGAKLQLLRSTGLHSPMRNNVDFVTFEEEPGPTEFAVYPVGQHVTFYRLDDGRTQFLARKSLSVREVLALSISPNKKVMAVSDRRGGGEQPMAQVSVFHLPSLAKIRTITLPTKAQVTCLSFSGDFKYLAGLSGEPDFQLLLWQWDKELLISSISLTSSNVNRVCCSPANPFQITTSGMAHLRMWAVGADGELKSKEQENFVDHTWMKGSVRRMIAIGDTLEPAAMKTTGASMASSTGQATRNPNIYIFQNGEVPTSLEIKQVILVNNTGNARLETVVAHAKGFLVAGTNGYFGVYEQTQDRKDPFLLIKTLRAGEETIRSMALSNNKETVLVCTKSERLLTFSLSAVDMMEEGSVAPFVDVFKGGFHMDAVNAMDIAIQKPIVATVGMDHTIRVWNYLQGKCQVVHNAKGEEAYAIAVHPFGFQCVAGFKEKVRIYNILLDDIKCLKELSLKHCREVKYSDGGHILACATGLSIAIYSSVTLTSMALFTGHIGIVRCLSFTQQDKLLYSAGADGNIHAWDMINLQKLEEPSGLEQPCPFTGMVVEYATSLDEPNHLACCGTDGFLRQLSWFSNTKDSNRVTEVQVGDDINANVLALSKVNKCLFAGLQSGNIRAYEWPLNGNFSEYPGHKAGVTVIRLSHDETRLVTAGEDGSMLIFGVQKVEDGLDVNFIDDHESVNASSNEFFLVTQEEIADRQQEFNELRKLYDDLKSDSEYNLHRKDAEWSEEMKTVNEDHKRVLQTERGRFEELQNKYESTVLEHVQSMEKKDNQYSEMLRDLEDQYEHKLAVEMERYDKLSEEIEMMKDECNAKLEDQKIQSETLIKDFETRASRMEQQLRHQIERLMEEGKFNDTTYREVLDQQEHEYESELKELISAAENEIQNERENTAKVRAIAQGKHTKLDQLRKKMVGIEQAAIMREKLLETERAKNQRLEATMAHLERHLEERNKSLEEKERSIVELRNNNRTLENFRYVLDHRLKQLMEERGPVTKHIEDLEAHIRAMYDDLVEEFSRKKEQTQATQTKDMKLATLQNEILTLRNSLRQKERVITNIKQEISNNVTLTVPKDIEEAVKDMYRKYVRNETSRSAIKTRQPIEVAISQAKQHTQMPERPDKEHKEGDGADGLAGVKKNEYSTVYTLLEGLEEANRQRGFMERRNEDLCRKMESAKKGAQKATSRSITENTELISYCNELRKTNLVLRREVSKLRTQIMEQQSFMARNASHLSKTAEDIKDSIDGDSRMTHAKSQPGDMSLVSEGEDGGLSVHDSSSSLHHQKKARGAMGPLSPGHPETAGASWRSGSLQKGPNRELNLVAARETEVLSLTRQLDEAHREAEMYKAQVASLRLAMVDMGKRIRPPLSAKGSKRPSHTSSPSKPHDTVTQITAPETDTTPGLIKRVSLHQRPAPK